MNVHKNSIGNNISVKMKWLINFRAFFAILLFGSTALMTLGGSISPNEKTLLFLYGIIAAILLLSIIYIIVSQYVLNNLLFIYIQLVVDTVIVTLIIFVTGSISSIFSFLYLVVIIFASMLIYRKGSMVIATFSSVQYAFIVIMELSGFLKPFDVEEVFIVYNYEWAHVLFKVFATCFAFYVVAFLSGLLAEQERKTKKEYLALEEHVKRVEKLAAIGEMAAGLAHEIKNPLASLSGSIQMLYEDRHYSADDEKLMKIILREADRLNSLVNNFLLFAKPQVGKAKPLDLGKTISDIIMLFEKDCSCRERVVFRKKIAENINIKMDSGHIKQILWNLLLNATEAINGEGEIKIDMFPIKNDRVCIEIADNGCGISDDILASIFTPFVTTKANGTGLGLSIVHRILESYEGRLNVTSSVGEGAVFTIVLKRC